MLWPILLGVFFVGKALSQQSEPDPFGSEQPVPQSWQPPTEPPPEPWYGYYIGSLPDPKGIGISGNMYIVNSTFIQILDFTYGGQAVGRQFLINGTSEVEVEVALLENDFIGSSSSSSSIYDVKGRTARKVAKLCLEDLYFWADKSNQLTELGVKIPTFEFGDTAIDAYESGRVVLELPKDYKVYDFRSFGLWCQAFAKDFGTVPNYMEKAHNPPKAKFLPGRLQGTQYGVGSGPILVLDRQTIKIYGFTFFGDKAPACAYMNIGKDGYFLVGKGTEPTFHEGVKVPIRGRDTPGLISAIKERYDGGDDVILDLPASHNIYNINWLSVYCERFQTDFGYVRIANISARIPPYVPPQKRYNDMPLVAKQVWPSTKLIGRHRITTFTFQLGPPGGRRAYESLAKARANQYVWYVNGLMTPEIWLKRGVTYTFRIQGGTDPNSEYFYNPLYISDEPFGGFGKLAPDEREQVNVFAGIDLTTKMPLSTSIGAKCEWKQRNKAANADLFDNFLEYREQLEIYCDATEQSTGTIKWTPDQNTPGTVYYQSYAHYNMGWKMVIVDELPDPSEVPDLSEVPFDYKIYLDSGTIGKVPAHMFKSAPNLSNKSSSFFSIIFVSLVYYFRILI